VKNTLNAYFAAYNVTTHRTASGIMPLETTLSTRVLFVDDEPSIRATLPVILKRRGYVVDVAATVAEALEALRIHRFDILICDLNIGRAEDGYTVIEAIRQVDPGALSSFSPDVRSSIAPSKVFTTASMSTLLSRPGLVRWSLCWRKS
jgi:CheY-like chemotaxis protein